MGGRGNSARIREIIKRVIAFLLLGAIINVAVAWGFVATCRVAPDEVFVVVRRSHSVKNEMQWRRFNPPASFGMRGFLAGTDYFRGVEYGEVWKPIEIGDASDTDAEYVIAGWPLLCVRGSEWRRIDFDHEPHTQDIRQSIIRWSNQAERIQFDTWLEDQKITVLPWGPIWPGFAINTIFYAAILWMLFAGPRVLRRKRRLRRGLCPICAYPIGESAVCTELRRAGNCPCPSINATRQYDLIMRFSTTQDWRVLKFVTLGAVVNLAVAWMCAIVSQPNTARQPYEGLDPEIEWHRHAAQYWDKPALSRVERWRAFGSDQIVVHPIGFGEMAGMYVEPSTLYAVDSGLPFRCLYRSHATKVDVVGLPTVRRCGLALPRSLPLLGGSTLPYGIFWFRLLMNTMFYAAVLWCVTAWTAIRRGHRRMRRGACPACAYPSGSSAVCTECGESLSQRT